MKVLFCMAHPGHARNFESTLRELAARSHQVVVHLDRSQAPGSPEAGKLLGRLVAELDGVSVHAPPARRRSNSAEVGFRARVTLDYLHLTDPGFAYSERLGERAARQVPGPVRRLNATQLGRRAAVRGALRHTLGTLERGVPTQPGVTELMERVRPDVVLVTPLVELGSPQAEYVRAARALGIPSVLPVASWDNLTTKGILREPPDLVTVWNEAQKEEAVALHGVAASRVAVTGAVAYDHWFEWTPSRDREAFCARVGLDPARPYVMHACSSGFIATDEGAHVLDWCEHVRRPGTGLEALQVLVRPHPTVALGPPAVLKRLEATEGVAVFPATGRDPVDSGSREAYFDSMHHSAAVVGINTSAFLEGAIAGRPTLTVLTDRFRETQRGLRHFGHLTTNGGPVEVAGSWDEHVDQLRAVLEDAAPAVSRTRAFLASFVRPHGLEVAAAPVLVDAVEALAGQAPAAKRASGVDRSVGRALALGGTALIRARLATGARTTSDVDAAVEWLEQRLTDLTEGGDRVVLAPCAGDLAFELLWWAPMLRWAFGRFPGLASRTVAVTRGTAEPWLPEELEIVTAGELGLDAAGADFDAALAERVEQRLGLPPDRIVPPAVFASARKRLLRAGSSAFLDRLRAIDGTVTGPAVVHRPLPAASRGDATVVVPHSAKAFAAAEIDVELTAALVGALADAGPVVVVDPSDELLDHPQLWRSDGRVTGVDEPADVLAAIAEARAYFGAYDGRAVYAALSGVPALALADSARRVDSADLLLVERLAALAEGIAPLRPLSPSQLPITAVRRHGINIAAVL